MAELNFVIEGILGLGVAALAGFAKREFNRIDDNFKSLFTKLDCKVDKTDYRDAHNKLETDMENKCKERRSTCDPCKKNVSGMKEDLGSAINCINKHVDNCDIGVR